MRHQSLLVTERQNGLSIAISTTHAESGPLDVESAVCISTVDCYCTKGASPVATTAAQFIPANMPLGLFGWKPGEQLSFVTASGTGTVHLSPGA